MAKTAVTRENKVKRSDELKSPSTSEIMQAIANLNAQSQALQQQLLTGGQGLQQALSTRGGELQKEFADKGRDIREGLADKGRDIRQGLADRGRNIREGLISGGGAVADAAGAGISALPPEVIASSPPLALSQGQSPFSGGVLSPGKIAGTAPALDNVLSAFNDSVVNPVNEAIGDLTSGAFPSVFPEVPTFFGEADEARRAAEGLEGINPLVLERFGGERPEGFQQGVVERYLAGLGPEDPTLSLENLQTPQTPQPPQSSSFQIDPNSIFGRSGSQANDRILDRIDEIDSIRQERGVVTKDDLERAFFANAANAASGVDALAGGSVGTVLAAAGGAGAQSVDDVRNRQELLNRGADQFNTTAAALANNQDINRQGLLDNRDLTKANFTQAQDFAARQQAQFEQEQAQRQAQAQQTLLQNQIDRELKIQQFNAAQRLELAKLQGEFETGVVNQDGVTFKLTPEDTRLLQQQPKLFAQVDPAVQQEIVSSVAKNVVNLFAGDESEAFNFVDALARTGTFDTTKFPGLQSQLLNVKLQVLAAIKASQELE